MAKEKMEHEDGKGKKPKKHLHQIRSVQAEDGSIVHHHTYKAKKEDHLTEPERENVATSGTPEEAGQHTDESFAQNQMGAGQAEPQPEDPEQGAEPMPGAGAPQAGA